MTGIHIIAGALVAVVIALVYFLGEAYAEIAKLKHHYNEKADLLINSMLEVSALKRKLEKINELTKL